VFKQIVVGTDGSQRANAAVEAAIEIAQHNGAILHVVHAHRVVPATDVAAGAEIGIAPVDVVEANAGIHEQGQIICDQVVNRAAQAGVRCEGHCVGGDAADSLIRIAETTHADLIVVGNRGMEGVRRFLLGSVPNKVSHHAPCSLLIIRTTQSPDTDS
jgi:nucleotide-binding universal stress UspA family protein